MAKKSIPKAPVPAVAASTIPKVWYFPTEDPNFVIRCDYNPAEKQYNQNCVVLPLNEAPGHIAAAINWSTSIEPNANN